MKKKAIATSVAAVIACTTIAADIQKAEANSRLMPSTEITALKNAKEITCKINSTVALNNGSAKAYTYNGSRKLIKRTYNGTEGHAFEYTYSTSGLMRAEDLPKAKYDYVKQQKDGSIETVAHEYGFRTSSQTDGIQRDSHTLTFLPAKLQIGKKWVGDSATISDVDNMLSEVTGMEKIKGASTWIITQKKIDTAPSPTRGIVNMEITYNLDPETLNTTWVFSHGNGIDKKTGKKYSFLYHADCD